MSEHEKDSVMDGLFTRQGMKLRNVKFCRGSRDVIAAEDLRAQSHSALLQRRVASVSGPMSTEAPRSKQPTVDLEVLFG